MDTNGVDVGILASCVATRGQVLTSHAAARLLENVSDVLWDLVGLCHRLSVDERRRRASSTSRAEWCRRYLPSKSTRRRYHATASARRRETGVKEMKRMPREEINARARAYSLFTRPEEQKMAAGREEGLPKATEAAAQASSIDCQGLASEKKDADTGPFSDFSFLDFFSFLATIFLFFIYFISSLLACCRLLTFLIARDDVCVCAQCRRRRRRSMISISESWRQWWWWWPILLLQLLLYTTLHTHTHCGRGGRRRCFSISQRLYSTGSI